MRQGQNNNNNNKRTRGRSRKGPNPLTRSFESNGPDVKIRGTALHIADKYAQLARDAQVSGNRVHGESLLQHAEHYYRIVAAAQAQMPQPQQVYRSDDDGADDDDQNDNGQDRAPQPRQDGQPTFGLSDPQPHINGADQDGSGGNDVARPDAEQPEQGARRERAEGSSRPRRRRPYRDRSTEQGEQAAADAPAPSPVQAEQGKEPAPTSED